MYKYKPLAFMNVKIDSRRYFHLSINQSVLLYCHLCTSKYRRVQKVTRLKLYLPMKKLTMNVMSIVLKLANSLLIQHNYSSEFSIGRNTSEIPLLILCKSNPSLNILLVLNLYFIYLADLSDFLFSSVHYICWDKEDRLNGNSVP